MSLRLDDGGFATGMGVANSRVDQLNMSSQRSLYNLYSMRAQMAILGFATAVVVGDMVRDWAEFEKQTSLAAFAAQDLKEALKMDVSDFDKDFRSKAENVRKEAIQLSKDLAIKPIDAARLVRQVQQFGINNAAQAGIIASAGAKLSLVSGGEIQPYQGAEAIYRLMKVTRTPNEQAELMANYINIAAQESAASPEQVQRFLRRFQVIGAAINMTPEQIVALTTLASDVDPGAREMFTTAATRLLTKGLVRERGRIARYLGMTSGDLEEKLRNEPSEGLIQIAETMGGIALGEEQPSSAMIAMGIKAGMPVQEQMRKLGLARNTRDILFFSLIKESKKYHDTLAVLNEEKAKFLAGQYEELGINRNVSVLLGQTALRWQALTASMERAGIVMGGMISEVLKPFMLVLTGIFDVIADNPLVAMSVALVGISLVLSVILRTFRAMRDVGAGIGMIAGTMARLHPGMRQVGYGVPMLFGHGGVLMSGAGGYATGGAMAALGRGGRGGGTLGALSTEAGMVLAATQAPRIGAARMATGMMGAPGVGMGAAYASYGRALAQRGTAMTIGDMMLLSAATSPALRRTALSALHSPADELGAMAMAGSALYPAAAVTSGAKLGTLARAGASIYGPPRALSQAARIERAASLRQSMAIRGMMQGGIGGAAGRAGSGLSEALMVGAMFAPWSKAGRALGGFAARKGEAMIAGQAAERYFGARGAGAVGRFGGRGLGQALGFFGGRAGGAAIVERLGAGALGRATLGAGAAAGIVSGPVGWVATALMILAPLFQNLGNTMLDAGTKTGGLIGWILQFIGALSKLVSVAGNFLSWIFNKIANLVVGVFTGIWNFLIGLPVVGDALKAIGGFVADAPKNIGTFADQMNEFYTEGEATSTADQAQAVADTRARSMGINPLAGGKTGSGGTFIQNVTQNVYAGDSKDYVNYKIGQNSLGAALNVRKTTHAQG